MGIRILEMVALELLMKPMIFLDAPTHFYEMVCPFVRTSFSMNVFQARLVAGIGVVIPFHEFSL